MHKVVECKHVVSGSLGDELVKRHGLKRGEILGGRHVGVVVVREVLELGRECGDELVACVSHAVSMAENRGKVKG